MTSFCRTRSQRLKAGQFDIQKYSEDMTSITAYVQYKICADAILSFVIEIAFVYREKKEDKARNIFLFQY